MFFNFYYFSKPLFFLILYIFGIVKGPDSPMYVYYCMGIFAMVFIFLFLKIIKSKIAWTSFEKRKLKLLLIPILFLIYLISNYIILGYSKPLSNDIRNFSALSLSGFFLGVFLDWPEDFRVLLDKMNIFNYLITSVLLLANLSMKRPGPFDNFATADHLLIGYTAGIFAIYNLYILLNTKKIIYKLLGNFVLLILQIYLIIASGSRGALIALLVIALLLVLKYFKIRKNISITIVIFLLLFSTMNILSKISPTFDFGKYRITKTFNGKGFIDWETAGLRETFYRNSIVAFLENPVIGGGEGRVEYSPGNKSYPHNLELEILAEYGIIGFIIFSIIIIGILRRSNFIIEKHEKESLLVFLIVYNLIALQFSGTFVRDFQLWSLLGILFSIPNNYFVNSSSRQVKTLEKLQDEGYVDKEK